MTHLDLLKEKLTDSEQPDVLLVPISMSYEFSPSTLVPETTAQCQDKFDWKPSVRVTFGIPHSFKVQLKKKFLYTINEYFIIPTGLY